ncbi:MAG TPA: nucleotidyltransferase domain-containing protein [Rhodothermales bacterium]|nr:nucleotidyltransferase domain-containing protein [Rhodothermales bacterium]
MPSATLHIPPHLRSLDLAGALAYVQKKLDDIQAVYLFGSAKDVLHKDSDIDLAILTDHPLTSTQRWALQEDLAAILHRDVDLVDLRSASTVMQVQVVAKGFVLYEADTLARQRFEMHAYARYAALNEERAAILNDIQQRGRVYGG